MLRCQVWSGFSYNIYRKATTTETIISMDSNHPFEHKMAAVRHLLNRANTYNLHTAHKQSEMDCLWAHRSSTQSFYHHNFKLVILHPSPLQPKIYTTSAALLDSPLTLSPRIWSLLYRLLITSALYNIYCFLSLILVFIFFIFLLSVFISLFELLGNTDNFITQHIFDLFSVKSKFVGMLRSRAC